MLDPSSTSFVPLRLAPSIQRYAWGDPSFIPRLLGLPVDGTPCAEAWFGAHPRAPATVAAELGPRPLSEVLEQDHALLGSRVQRRFGQLPYLLKLLAAARPLSIQVHPSREQARAGYLREEALGLAPDSAKRSYHDPNHKPEIIVALTSFHALSGFRSPDAITRDVEKIPELRALVPPFEPTSAGLAHLLDAYFRLPAEVWKPGLEGIAERLSRSEGPLGPGQSRPHELFLELHRGLQGRIDRGLLFAFLLEFVRLEPGEALFLEAGVPHAYLRGAGVELMANSDNVLRAGLTEKNVDPDELQKIVRFDAARPRVLRAAPSGPFGVSVYETPAEEFRLRRFCLDASTCLDSVADGPDTLLVTAGSIEVTDRRNLPLLELGPGQACLVPHGSEYRLRAANSATVFCASVP